MPPGQTRQRIVLQVGLVGDSHGFRPPLHEFFYAGGNILAAPRLRKGPDGLALEVERLLRLEDGMRVDEIGDRTGAGFPDILGEQRGRAGGTAAHQVDRLLFRPQGQFTEGAGPRGKSFQQGGDLGDVAVSQGIFDVHPVIFFLAFLSSFMPRSMSRRSRPVRP